MRQPGGAVMQDMVDHPEQVQTAIDVKAGPAGRGQNQPSIGQDARGRAACQRVQITRQDNVLPGAQPGFQARGDQAGRFQPVPGAAEIQMHVDDAQPRAGAAILNSAQDANAGYDPLNVGEQITLGMSEK